MPNPIAITLAHRAIRSDQVLSQDLDGEAVLLDLASEQYFGLNPVGTRIWDLLDGQTPLGAIQNVLCAEYDVDPTLIGKDLLALADALTRAGLVRVG